jgi:hypothetical protein
VTLASPAPTPQPWTNDPRQLALRADVEREIAPWVAQIYQEAIRALQDPSNPERLGICCYLLREVLDAIPRVKLNKKVEGGKANDLIIQLDTHWNARANDPKRMEADNKTWRHEPWMPLAKFLQRMGELLSAYRSDWPRKRALRARAFELLNPRIGSMERKEFVDYMEALEEIERFFNAVLHHDKNDATECEEQVAAFERFLADLINAPRFFANRRLIEQLVKEAEA